LKNLQLREFRAAVAPDSPPQELGPQSTNAPLPLAVVLRGGSDSSDDSNVLYEVDREKLQLGGDDEGALNFVGELDGATIRKTVKLNGNRYLWHLEVGATHVPPQFTELAIAWDTPLDSAGSGYGQLGTQSPLRPFNSILALQNDKLQRSDPAALEEAPVLLENNIEWAGFSGQYFFAGIIPASEEAAASVRIWARSSGDDTRMMLLLPQGEFGVSLDVYTGPKDLDHLENAGRQLNRAIDLGWFTFVARPMLQLLRFLNRFTGNYGFDIILLTVLIKILFFPLTQKSMRSMKGMQKLQPEMTKIREDLKDKPDEMNKAVMELYKTHKVNPLGGCLPMLLQLPVFFGLYQALLNAVELRHAPFLGWITDLSAPDRLGSLQLPMVDGAGFPVMTLIMGASMILQQWMTPVATVDPMQQRMMMLMPVVFTFMFINFPAGLTLYWLVNNILTIAQQMILNREK
jgi:YidC/Oxa1 family membrane protein insertase